MTTILVSAKEMKIASDTISTVSDINNDELKGWAGGRVKLLSVKYAGIKYYIGGAGNCSELDRLKEFFSLFGRLDEPSGDVDMLVVHRRDNSLVVQKYESLKESKLFKKIYKWRYTELIGDEIQVGIGSGSKFALGALYSGKCVKESIEIASKLDTSTGNEVDVYDIE